MRTYFDTYRSRYLDYFKNPADGKSTVIQGLKIALEFRSVFISIKNGLNTLFAFSKFSKTNPDNN